MGVDYRLACNRCHEFLELHKWFPDDELSMSYPADLKYDKYRGSVTNKDKLERAILTFEDELEKECPGHWIENLVPYVRSFVKKHDGHSLVIYNDTGDMPWYPFEPDWHKWKEIKGPMSCWDEHYGDVDLPRNIIDDIGIDNWGDALKHYVDNCPCVTYPRMPDDMESIFEMYLKKRRPKV